jgi:hypothetical protein
MVEVEIHQEDKGSFIYLKGDVTLGLTKEQYQQIVVVSRENMKADGYYLQYEKLRCSISYEDGAKLIALGATVKEFMP